MTGLISSFLGAASAAKPAGGAATGEVVGATAGALVATGALFWLGMTYRAGRNSLLRRAADISAHQAGLPRWAALPGDIATLSLLAALFGMYWDISLHIDQGRDAGPLANPAHYFILVGLFGIFAAGFLAIVLPERGEKPGPASVRIAKDWYAPIGGLLMLFTAGFALAGFPLDDMWHRLFGQDVTLWGPTHLMLIGGAGLTLVGMAALWIEGRRAVAADGVDAQPGVLEQVPGPLGFVISVLHRSRYAGVFGGLLIGLSTFQGEFDFGVPQFQLVFHPILIAFAAGGALVAARIFGGRGTALVAVLYFWVIRGGVSLLVGPGLGEVTPHLPLYFAEAAVVELVALFVATRRPYVFGAVAGIGIGTLGTAAEWGWSHVWMPIAWPDSILGETVWTAPLAGLTGGLVGGFVGAALATPLGQRKEAPRLRIAPAAAGVALIAAIVAFGLSTDTERGLRAQVALTDVRQGPDREANATVRISPADAADDAKWLTATAWQGGGKLVVNRLERVGPGTYRTTEPIPLHGDWKTVVRLHAGNSLVGVPVYMPSDPEIPAPGVPAPARFERAFVADHEILQRELKDDVSSVLPPLAYGTVLAIVLMLVGALGWALARLANEGPLRPRKPGPPAVNERLRDSLSPSPSG